MTPAELGTLVDGTPDMRDITATIVDLAVRGSYCTSTEKENEHFFGLFSSKDYTFTLKKHAWRVGCPQGARARPAEGDVRRLRGVGRCCPT